MNVSLANKIAKLTPKHILRPENTAPSLDTPLPLSNGSTIPAIGYAAWNPETEPEQVHDDVVAAIKAGYRHFDASSRNEAEVGKAIRDAVNGDKVKRVDLFVTATARNYYLPEVESSLDESLQNLGLKYVDLFMVDYDSSEFEAVWSHMQKLPVTNKTKAIGISNIGATSLNRLMDSSFTLPTAVCVVTNPYEPEQEIINICREKNILVIAYSPFRSEDRGSLFNLDVFTKISDKHSTVPESVLLSWQVARGCSVLVNEVILGGSEANRKLALLDEEDLNAISKLAGEA